MGNLANVVTGIFNFATGLPGLGSVSISWVEPQSCFIILYAFLHAGGLPSVIEEDLLGILPSPQDVHGQFQACHRIGVVGAPPSGKAGL